MCVAAIDFVAVDGSSTPASPAEPCPARPVATCRYVVPLNIAEGAGEFSGGEKALPHGEAFGYGVCGDLASASGSA